MIPKNKNPLSSISNNELVRRLNLLVRKEREITLKLLLHLIEMDRRNLYVERGYASLFEYCTRSLGYSESAANRRIRSARCIRDYPEIFGLLDKNKLNLTVLSRIAGIINDQNKGQLLEEVCNRSKRQVEAIVARYNPKSLVPDRVKTVYLKTNGKKSVANESAQANETSLSSNCAKFTTAGGGKKFTTAKIAETKMEKRFKLEFAVSPEVMAKIEHAKKLLSTKYPKGVKFEQLLDTLLEEFIEKHCPERKQARREKQNRSQTGRNQGMGSTKDPTGIFRLKLKIKCSSGTRADVRI